MDSVLGTAAIVGIARAAEVGTAAVENVAGFGEAVKAISDGAESGES